MNNKYLFVFLRHGRSVGMNKNILLGRKDIPLSAEGQREVSKLAEYWANRNLTYDLIISSPMLRTLETARIISNKLKVQIEVNDIWIARDFGKAEGTDLEIIKDWYKGKIFPNLYENIYETGESEMDIHIRAAEAINQILTYPPGKYLVVSHGNMINAALHIIFGVLPLGRSLPIELALQSSGYAQLSYDSEVSRWSLLSFNAMDHLSYPMN